ERGLLLARRALCRAPRGAGWPGIPRPGRVRDLPAADGHPAYPFGTVSCSAEREGFEPSVRFNPYTAFPVPHLRPLGHLSETLKVFAIHGFASSLAVRFSVPICTCTKCLYQNLPQRRQSMQSKKPEVRNSFGTPRLRRIVRTVYGLLREQAINPLK